MKELETPWTITKIREVANTLGKEIKIDEENTRLLEPWLIEGAAVFFTEEEVDEAILQERMPRNRKQKMMKLIDGEYGFAVIGAETMKMWGEEVICRKAQAKLAQKQMEEYNNWRLKGGPKPGWIW